MSALAIKIVGPSPLRSAEAGAQGHGSTRPYRLTAGRATLTMTRRCYLSFLP
ncbi:MAG: hypothetical protein Q7S29_03080 [Candidatus Peribacter sp.]|nr:hypothetical protein [Candidatus Peribacter sp.]